MADENKYSAVGSVSFRAAVSIFRLLQHETACMDKLPFFFSPAAPLVHNFFFASMRESERGRGLWLRRVFKSTMCNEERGQFVTRREKLQLRKSPICISKDFP